ncbi:MAG: hypothetical protein ACRDCI_02775 [Plesiomonas shigelloides]
MAKITYLDDLQQMQADHIWGKVRKMRKQKAAKELERIVAYGVLRLAFRAYVRGGKRVARPWVFKNLGYQLTPKAAPYAAYRSKVAARFAGRAGRVARQLIMMGDY